MHYVYLFARLNMPIFEPGKETMMRFTPIDLHLENLELSLLAFFVNFFLSIRDVELKRLCPYH